MLKFVVGKSSQSNVGFMTEVNVAGLRFSKGFWALGYGHTLEESRSRAARIAEALSSIEEVEALLRATNPSAEAVEHFQAWMDAVATSTGSAEI